MISEVGDLDESQHESGLQLLDAFAAIEESTQRIGT